MSIPISIISQFSPPVTKVSTPFFSILEIGMKRQMRNSPQVWEECAGLHKLHLPKLININIFKYINLYKKNNEKK